MLENILPTLQKLRGNKLFNLGVSCVSDETMCNLIINKLPLSDEDKIALAKLLLDIAKERGESIGKLLLSDDFADLVSTFTQFFVENSEKAASLAENKNADKVEVPKQEINYEKDYY